MGFTTHPNLAPEYEPKSSSSADEAAAKLSELAASCLRQESHCPESDNPTNPLTVPGYELLGELGRGGMGVVYKARQLALKRLVALKMILAGPRAHADLLERFRIEAEAVARFQHPNIVQLHEVGTQAGAPYCVLEFVDGGSLARRLVEGVMPCAEAARVTEQLARAMHYAHQRNVLHRDLKPANVLMTSDGQPKITDFGLAKQLDSDSGQTQSGQVMGTPSYMAPEQAAGRVRELGPATDVYSLGAILYELLTGQPPFKGASVLETLEQVRSREPTPPTRLQPQLPRDLETICLKCLMKEPRQRYSSALALAQDLERFQAGESILARPEGFVRKLWRRANRQRGLTVAALAVLIAVGVAATFGLETWRGRRVAVLQRTIESELDDAAWSPAQLGQLDAALEQLARLNPDAAASLRQRLLRRYRTYVDTILDKPRLEPEDVAHIQEQLAELAKRVPEDAGALGERLRLRQGAWDVALDVRAPFTDWDRVFPAAVVRLASAGLITQRQPDEKRLTNPETAELVVLNNAPVQGNVELEANFDESWDRARRLGLHLSSSNARAGGETRAPGYTFVLALAPALERSTATGQPTSFHEARKDGRRVCLQIWSGGVCLAERAIAPPTGRGTLRARRSGARLELQLNQFEPLVFLEVFSPAWTVEKFGLLWPDGVTLSRLTARLQRTPVRSSPLERGDALVSHGQYAEALAAFHQQAEQASVPVVRQEAEYKKAFCHLKLNHLDEAGTLLEQVAAQAGERWPAAAACQLWLLRLQQDRREEADALYVVLSSRFRFGELLAVLTEQERQDIFRAYRVKGLDHFLARPNLVGHLERAVEVADFLRLDPMGERQMIQMELGRAYLLAGKPENALQAARQWFTRFVGERPEQRLWGVSRVLLDYSWLLRLRGEPREALRELDRWLYRAPGVFVESPITFHFLLERVRIQAALGDWSGVERDLDECLRRLSLSNSAWKREYFCYSSTYLMLGYACEQRGDRVGALDAWRKGTFKGWLRQLPEEERARAADSLGAYGAGSVHQIILGGLSDEFSDAEAEQFLGAILRSFSGDGLPAQFAATVRVPPSAFRLMWQSRRGREYARRIAFRDLPYDQYSLTPLYLLASEVFRQGAFARTLTADEDQVLWETVQTLYGEYAQQKLSKTQLLQLALTWKGTLGFLGWGSLAPALPPRFRGPCAYLFGQRYRQLKREQDAVTFFRTAVADAAAASLLKRLSEQELTRQPGKP